MQSGGCSRHPAFLHQAAEDMQVVQAHRSHDEDHASQLFSFQRSRSGIRPADYEPYSHLPR